MQRIEIPGTDADLQAVVADVNLPTLMVVLAHLTGDDSWMAEFTPKPIAVPEGSMFPDDSGGFDEETAARIRARALEELMRLRAERPPMPAPPGPERMRALLEWSVAEPVTDGDVAMLLEETGFVDRDADWRERIEAAIDAGGIGDFKVIVVGAGMSGICAGIKLRSVGIPFTIIEKNDAVGGTWYENSYPDCGVDTPNHFYSYSFYRNPNWSGYFSKRDELYAYFEHCVDEFGIRDAIEFETEVRSMRWDDRARRWTVTVRRADGREDAMQAKVVISAVGQLNRPNIPDIEGLDSFAGTYFHSARWRHDVDLTGKRVAVIGTGCSAVQLLPKTAERAAHVDVYQRTPHWLSPNKDYYRPVEPGLIWALNHVPTYAEWHRARMIFGFNDRNWPAVEADPDWPHPERAMNPISDELRAAITAHIAEQLGDRQDLLAKVVPDFPVFGKRLVIDNNWYPTLARDDVTLVTDPIARVTPRGIETADGVEREVDVIVFATGFKSNLFLWPMEVSGRSGTRLAEQWGDHPRAYKGINVPDYPNLFCLYGPNTNIVHGGSIIFGTECEVHYVMQCLALMLEQRVPAIEVRAEVTEAYNAEVQAISARLAWGHSGVQSWYKNAQGVVVNNSPFPNQKFWEITHDVRVDDYALAQD